MADFPAQVFKSYDIRGKVGSELNEHLVHDIGRAFADFLPTEGPVAVGYDMRPDSKAYATAIIAGLTEQGRDVWDLGMIATDMIYFAVGSNKLAGGAVVTASHNPGEFNGIKLCREDAIPVGEFSGLFGIRDAVKAQSFKNVSNTGTVANKDIVEGWIGHVLSFIDTAKLKPLNIAVDAGNGMAGEIFAELEPYVPWRVKEMYFEPDGTFPNHEANPMKSETLVDIIKEIKQNNLDGGIAFDGDGDRAFLLDETGKVIPGSAMSALLADYFAGLNPGATIIYDVRSSKYVAEVITAAGGKPFRTKVGHSNIKQAMREHNAPYGGESSGHFYFKENWFADSGLIAAVIGLYVATINNVKLSDLRKKYTKYFAIEETNFVVEDKDAKMEEIVNAYPLAVSVDRLDGVTLTFKNGSWMNIRPSNTESLLRLNVEAESEQELDALVSGVSEYFTK
ncbi:phosphomannomutase/phosphoglucomutase [Candidatus Saccharibacteria bacterium]|nr:phosphomannomutase/phosphoglucomutase [Candidatus Saccharibacteria bacterium]MDQ5958673.1 phosphomannomutase [Patescibacteria group bacterium]